MATTPSCDALALQACALQRAERAGSIAPVLRGKNFGLVCEDPSAVDAELFYRAATELGAQVARIRPSVAGLENDVRNTSRWLGRLYDGVECQDLPAALIEQMREAAGVPVLDGVTRASRPGPGVAAMLGDDFGAADAQRYFLQATLIEIFG